MKKTFSARRNVLFSSMSASWGAYALAVSVLALLFRLLAPNIFFYITAPIFSAADTLSLRSRTLFSSLGEASALSLENERLARESVALSLENESLVKKMKSVSELGEAGEGIIAGVVARPPESPYDTIVIAAGERQGVVAGMRVFGPGEAPVGTISSASRDFSRATLFSSPGIITQGWITDANIPVTVTGSGAGSMRTTLSRSIEISVGATVFTAGPGMLPLGKVAWIETNPSSSSMTLHISSAWNPFSLSWVVVRETGTSLDASSLPAAQTRP